MKHTEEKFGIADEIHYLCHMKTMRDMKTTLWFATEENGFEAEKIGAFESAEAAANAVAEQLKEDGLSEEAAEVLEGAIAKGGAFNYEDEDGYYCTYIIANEGEDIEGELENLREEWGFYD